MIFILANNFNTWASVKDSDYSRKYYIAPDIGIGCPIFHANNGLLTVEFPYTTTNQAGNTSHNIFTQNCSKLIHEINSGAGFGLEYGTLQYKINVHADYLPDNGLETGNTFAILGIGYNLYIDFHTNSIKPLAERPIVLTLLANAMVWNTYNANLIGTINNQNTTISLLGKTANPTYTVSGRGGSSTENAQNLEIFYNQMDWFIGPGLSIGNNYFNKPLHFEFKIAYYMCLNETAGVSLRQDNINAVSGLIPFGSEGLSSTFNGTVTTHPYLLLSGIYLGCTIAWEIEISSHRDKGGFYVD